MTVRVAAFLASLLAAACGGGGRPTQPASVAPPTTTLPPAPTAQHGVTHQPVTAEIEPLRPALSARMAVRAPGFLGREQPFDGGPVFLWPGDPTYIQDLTYHEFTDGSFRTTRWESGFTVTVDPDLADDPSVMAKVREVAAEAARASGLPVTVGAGGAVTIGVDANLIEDDAVAIADNSYRGATIIGSRLTFWHRAEISGGGRANYGNTLLHEMGHTLGLGHSNSDVDVMTPGEGRGTRVAAYQPDEAGCLHMLYAHRRAGNRFPDIDPALGAATNAGPRRVRFVEYRRPRQR